MKYRDIKDTISDVTCVLIGVVFGFTIGYITFKMLWHDVFKFLGLQ